MPPPSTTVKRDPAVVAAELKAQAEQEKIRRRASISIPASLSAPQIVSEIYRVVENVLTCRLLELIDLPNCDLVAEPDPRRCLSDPNPH